MPLSLLPHPFSFINTFFILSLFFFPTYLSSDDAKGYKACEPFRCGNFSGIRYPFWSSNQPDYCGHPKFKLDCQQDNLTIDIKSQKFQIIDIIQKSQILKLARLDLLDGTCPKQYINVNLDFDFFNYTSNDDSYTLLYDCGPAPAPAPYTYPGNLESSILFSCLIDGDPHDGYLVPRENVVNFISLGCKNNITVPVLKEVFQNAFINDSPVDYVLDQGFDVGWRGVDGDNCDSCIQSGGRCGFNASINTFMCLCLNQQSYGEICSKNPELSPLAAPISLPTPTHTLLPPYGPEHEEQANHSTKWNWKRKYILGVTAAMIGFLIGITVFCFKRKSSISQGNFWLTRKSNQDIEAFLKNHGAQTLKRYKFSDVKKMTNSFKVKLGQGGFGTVYEGKLLTGCLVAVKVLNSSKGNNEDFINEVASISRTSHVNVVTLLGFCLEGRKKALIYEFMPNGSLDKFIYRKEPETTPPLSWDILYQISIGIARGLEYLHKGCNTRILHFDIKPHNILLDENFCPKISDFGLAKLCPEKQSIISMSDARGTMGYVAPEVWNRHFGGVSHKSDVYSYGMMLLEMVGGRKNINAEASHTSEIYFPHWVYKRLEEGIDLRLNEVMSTKENEISKKMIMVGLWCIQTIPNDRPTMRRVIDMLEGNTNSLEMPPKPFLSSPTRSVAESSTSLN